MTLTTMRLHFTVNGESRELEVPALRRLLDVLRDDLGLTGTKEGCGEGECGACTVLIDGEAVVSCLIAACQVDGRRVVTIEDAGLDLIGEAFLQEGGAQCGICTPGMIVMTRAFLDEQRQRGEPVTHAAAREALAGNLCRCTGYGAVLASVLAAAGSTTNRATDSAADSAAEPAADSAADAAAPADPHGGALP